MGKYLTLDELNTLPSETLYRGQCPNCAVQIAKAAADHAIEWAREHPGEVLSKSVIKRVEAQ